MNKHAEHSHCHRLQIPSKMLKPSAMIWPCFASAFESGQSVSVVAQRNHQNGSLPTLSAEEARSCDVEGWRRTLKDSPTSRGALQALLFKCAGGATSVYRVVFGKHSSISLPLLQTFPSAGISPRIFFRKLRVFFGRSIRCRGGHRSGHSTAEKKRLAQSLQQNGDSPTNTLGSPAQ